MHAPRIRKRIGDGLDWLGIALDLERNTATALLISRDAGRVTVGVIGTNEELMIARSVMRPPQARLHPGRATPRSPPRPQDWGSIVGLHQPPSAAISASAALGPQLPRR